MNKLPEKLLNKRCELIARCRHKAKFKSKKNIEINCETRKKTYPIYAHGKIGN